MNRFSVVVLSKILPGRELPTVAPQLAQVEMLPHARQVAELEGQPL
jgi:hypothetical protein